MLSFSRSSLSLSSLSASFERIGTSKGSGGIPRGRCEKAIVPTFGVGTFFTTSVWLVLVAICHTSARSIPRPTRELGTGEKDDEETSHQHSQAPLNFGRQISRAGTQRRRAKYGGQTRVAVLRPPCDINAK